MVGPVGVRTSNGDGVTFDTSDITGKNTSRYKFNENAVKAMMNSSSQVHKLSARCRSKLSLVLPALKRISQAGRQRCHQLLVRGPTATIALRRTGSVR